MNHRFAQFADSQIKLWDSRNARNLHVVPRQPRVLIADDNKSCRDLHSILIRDMGCEVESVADGEAALMKLAFQHFDLLVTDWRMPRLDGASLVVWMRATGNAMPVVVISGCDPNEFPATTRRELVALLPKPVSAGHLIHTVGKVLHLEPAPPIIHSIAPFSNPATV